MSETISRERPFCPCCQLPDNLFLPAFARSDTEANNTVDDIEYGPLLDHPKDAWDTIKAAELVIVDTHSHAHLERTEDDHLLRENDCDDETDPLFIVISCSVQQQDWSSCLEYASVSKNRVAALGIHPWYLADLEDNWLESLEALIKQHPGCMVGEIGLCKFARFLRTYPEGKQAALQLQRDVFVKQLQLAATYERPVTVHCVNQQGVLLEVLKSMSTLPPVIGLHSFTGTAHHVRELLKWEGTLGKTEPLLYFGFSYTVNYVMNSSEKSRRQGMGAIRTVPRYRLLAESDVHATDTLRIGTAGAIAYMSWVLEEPLHQVAEVTSENAMAFLRQLRV